MTREQKIEMVAGTTNHSVGFITEIVEGNDQRLENMVLIAKAQISDSVTEAIATMS